MNYRHAFHAGNFADVFKHYLLTLLIGKLNEKKTPYAVLDTHAGAGLYDLTSEEAQKTREREGGIAHLLEQHDLPESLNAYLHCVEHHAPLYPGSPAVSAYVMRPTYRLLLNELHLEEYAKLKWNMRRRENLVFHNQDAYVALNALIPFEEKRGLILIDPPFEQKDEFLRLESALKQAHKKFPQGIYAIWYPIKDPIDAAMFYDALATTGFDKILISEFFIHATDDISRLNGCGMAILNAPWKLDETLNATLPPLHALLKKDADAITRTYFL